MVWALFSIQQLCQLAGLLGPLDGFLQGIHILPSPESPVTGDQGEQLPFASEKGYGGTQLSVLPRRPSSSSILANRIRGYKNTYETTAFHRLPSLRTEPKAAKDATGQDFVRAHVRSMFLRWALLFTTKMVFPKGLREGKQVPTDHFAGHALLMPGSIV